MSYMVRYLVSYRSAEMPPPYESTERKGHNCIFVQACCTLRTPMHVREGGGAATGRIVWNIAPSSGIAQES